MAVRSRMPTAHVNYLSKEKLQNRDILIARITCSGLSNNVRLCRKVHELLPCLLLTTSIMIDQVTQTQLAHRSSVCASFLMSSHFLHWVLYRLCFLFFMSSFSLSDKVCQSFQTKCSACVTSSMWLKGLKVSTKEMTRVIPHIWSIGGSNELQLHSSSGWDLSICPTYSLFALSPQPSDFWLSFRSSSGLSPAPTFLPHPQIPPEGIF